MDNRKEIDKYYNEGYDSYINNSGEFKSPYKENTKENLSFKIGFT